MCSAIVRYRPIAVLHGLLMKDVSNIYVVRGVISSYSSLTRKLTLPESPQNGRFRTITVLDKLLMQGVSNFYS